VIFLTADPKLPASSTGPLKGILEAIDMDSYRAEVQASLRITLADQDSEIEPVPTAGGGQLPGPDLDLLSNILRTFNDQFGNIEWRDADKIRQVISVDIPAMVEADKAYPERSPELRPGDGAHRAR
jgi:type I restriction enzyme R subunit